MRKSNRMIQSPHVYSCCSEKYTGLLCLHFSTILPINSSFFFQYLIFLIMYKHPLYSLYYVYWKYKWWSIKVFPVIEKNIANCNISLIVYLIKCSLRMKVSTKILFSLINTFWSMAKNLKRPVWPCAPIGSCVTYIIT